ncbi:hypothetical protein KIN20_014119 [Parelaphostrongylus tenuis]|uniref:Uncharacterized protein n=1 Tax=Parelaphostrongylus tenuis TaxID=148309 RepID=A0AAD5QP25_PARTN|nr:hypothetical protein KIN20_014119 [Parelaphostrongylus tenuis]
MIFMNVKKAYSLELGSENDRGVADESVPHESKSSEKNSNRDNINPSAAGWIVTGETNERYPREPPNDTGPLESSIKGDAETAT